MSLLQPGTTLGPYKIVSQLGSGGMGVVYTATDPRLDRRVAIKLLPPDLTRDETAKQRFLQEAKAASALDHPNICTIFEINETDDGQLYLVMAHYEGETLKERIGRGPLELTDAIDIATQVGQGLTKAHAAGIVHRDIKPANLMVTTDGTVKILDFGLAKLAGAEGMTQTGTTLGTVAYMSPEQLRGEEVDHRTDIWSLGVVLFEMVAGARPFKGERLEAVSVNVLQSQPTSLAVSRTGVSADLERMVNRALVKPVAERYQTATDLLGELRKLQSSPTMATPTQRDLPSIAVLPFVNMSADPEQEYFCDGLAEELIDALAQLDGLRVVSRSSSFQFRGKGHDLREVGQKLKVKTVLEGSVRKAGNRLRINAQLISTEDDYHLWSQRYDRTMDDIFAVQDQIAHAVMEKLRVKLLGASDAPLVTPATHNLEAYNLFLKGRYHLWKMSAPAFEQALACFTQSLHLEPNYAHGHAGIAQVHACRAIFSFEAPHSVIPGAKDAALKALAIDETVGDAHAALAMVLDYYEWDWAGAEREHRRAMELNPGDTMARAGLTQLLSKTGRVDLAVAEARASVDRDPIEPLRHHQLGLAFITARRFDEAIAASHTGIELDPSYYLLYWMLGLGLAGLGKHDEAVAALRQARERSTDAASTSYLGWALGVAGQKQEAAAILEELGRRRGQEYVGGVLLAIPNVGLGDYDRAMEWLQAGSEERDGMLTFVNGWFLFDPLRSDPRFQALLRKMNFPPASAE